jgi:Double zinc ribbon
MHCLGCGFDNPDGMNFCGKCGTPLNPRCPHCEFENPASFTFCGKCGTALVARSQSPVASPQPPVSRSVAYPPHLAERIRAEQTAMEARGATDGERKTITALFADIKGSMALTVVDEAGSHFYVAELWRLKGKLTLAQSSVQSLASSVQKEAEECFLKAIEIARRQQAKSWELRASTSLARLWQQQGKKTEAHEMLAKIYGWFTEGFDTKDLQEAKALLEELH